MSGSKLDAFLTEYPEINRDDVPKTLAGLIENGRVWVDDNRVINYDTEREAVGVIQFREGNGADAEYLGNTGTQKGLAGTATITLVSRLTGKPKLEIEKMPSRVVKVATDIAVFFLV